MGTESRKFIANEIILILLFVLAFSVASSTNSNCVSVPINLINNCNLVSVSNLTANSQNLNTIIRKNQSTKISLTALSKQKIQLPQSKWNLTVPKSVLKKDGHIVYNRIYTNILKCSYTGGNTYIVRRGDTLFYIAWITGNDFYNLAQINNIKAPYNLDVGQKLQVLYNSKCKTRTQSATAPIVLVTSKNANVQSVQRNSTAMANKSEILCTGNLNIRNLNKTLQNKNKFITDPAALTTSVEIKSIKSEKNSNFLSKLQYNQWYWPTEGKIIENFSLENGNKGIDIAGSKGQSIFAAASGLVVYAGNALRGYGNLIIIKHKNDYLSAYAHNDTILVKERQEVKGRERIATMGNTGTNSVRLHFEIRYKGKPVNPIQHLSYRQFG